MKILLITQNFYPEIGSGSNRFKNIYSHLSKKHDVKVLTTDPSYPNETLYNDEKYWNEPEINQSKNILRLKMRMNKTSKSMRSRILYYMELAFKVWLYIKDEQHKYDVIYVTSPNIFLPWASFFFQKKLKNTIRILEIRDLWPDSVKDIGKLNIDWIFPVLKYLEKRMYRKADKIIINNEGFRHHVENMMSGKPMLYIPNSFTRNELTSEPHSEEFKVIYAGNIGFAQSYDMLLEISHLLEENKIKFTVIGYGVNSHKFKEKIEENNFEYVSVHEEKNRQESLLMMKKHNVSLSILKESDIFLNVLPGKIIDSIGCGVPVVTNLGGYTNQLINKYKVGFAKEKALTEEIVNYIIKLKNKPELIHTLKNNSKNLVEDHFLWENNILKLERFLNEQNS